jgi:hypothetical protein
MNANLYTNHVTAIHGAEVVAKASMKSAAEEAKQFYEPEEDGVYDIGISADGTWRRRGYLSSYGVVTGMSLITGKVLDIEVMSKEKNARNVLPGAARKVQRNLNIGGKVINTTYCSNRVSDKEVSQENRL